MKSSRAAFLCLVISMVLPVLAQQPPSADQPNSSTPSSSPPSSSSLPPTLQQALAAPPTVNPPTPSTNQPAATLDESGIRALLAGIKDLITTFLSIFATIVVSILILLFTLQERFNRRLEKDWGSWSDRQEDTIARWRDDWDRELEPRISPHLETLLESKHLPQLRDGINEQVRQALGSTNAERGLLLARLRRFRNEVGACLEPIDAQAAECFREHAAEAIQNWHTLGMLFSTVKDDVLKGLQGFSVMPFKEAASRLEELKNEYRGDAQVSSEINYALQALHREAPPVVEPPQREVTPQKKSTKRKRTPKKPPDDTVGS